MVNSVLKNLKRTFSFAISQKLGCISRNHLFYLIITEMKWTSPLALDPMPIPNKGDFLRYTYAAAQKKSRF